jgi:hypothetical protein
MMANDVEGYEMHSCGKKINVTIEDDKENIKWQ